MSDYINRTSLSYWYPLVKHLNIPTPRTETILEREDPFEWFGILDGERLPEKDEKLLFETAKDIGYPLFMKNDLTSGKHQYLKTCYVPDEQSLLNHLYNIVEDAALKDQLITSLVLREYIDLDSKFKAFNGLPISVERRYFISHGKVTCRHPYWPEEAIKFYHGTAPVPGWESLLSEMNTETETEIALLTGYAEMIATVLEGDWSLDFAKSRSGLWYFIDAAEASKSWHPDCPNSKNPTQKKRKRTNKKGLFEDFIP